MMQYSIKEERISYDPYAYWLFVKDCVGGELMKTMHEIAGDTDDIMVYDKIQWTGFTIE